MHKLLPCCVLLLSGLGWTVPSLAAECIEINTPNTAINSGGRYCLSANLESSNTTLIAINANNVEFDCRGFTLHSTNTTQVMNTYGVLLQNRSNVHVRNCRITGGFAAGIYAYQNNGLANQNQNLSFTGNTISGAKWYGILAYGTDIDIRDNRIYRIGGRGSFAMGIRVGGSTLAGEGRTYMVRDNVIRDVASPVNYGYGIYANNAKDSDFADNAITGTTSVPGSATFGVMVAAGGGNTITGNRISGSGDDLDVGIQAIASDSCYHNHIRTDFISFGCNTGAGNY